MTNNKKNKHDMENFNKRIYDLHMEIIDAIFNLFEKTGRKRVKMEDTFSMWFNGDYVDANLVKCVYDGLTLTLYDDEGYTYGISAFSSVEVLAVFYETLVWYLIDSKKKVKV